MLETLLIALIATVVVVVYTGWRAVRILQCGIEGRDARLLELAQDNMAMRTTIDAYHKTLTRTTGGVGKRISECREITEALSHVPEVFKNEPGLIYWLGATDQFLVELHGLLGDPLQAHTAASRSQTIYRTVHEQSGIPLPPTGAAANPATI